MTPATTWLEDEMESVVLAFGLRGVDIKGGQEDGTQVRPEALLLSRNAPHVVLLIV